MLPRSATLACLGMAVLLVTTCTENVTDPGTTNPQSVSVLTNHNDNTRAGFNFPNCCTLTLLVVSAVSWSFKPARVLSLWFVSTDTDWGFVVPGSVTFSVQVVTNRTAMPRQARVAERGGIGGRKYRLPGVCGRIPIERSVVTGPLQIPVVDRKESSPMTRLGSTIAATCLLTSPLAAQETAPPPVVGTWDLTLTARDGRPLPSWLQVHVSGHGVLVGRFQGVVGSVRPISRLTYANDTLRFAIPPQWEAGQADLQFAGVVTADGLAGTITDPSGNPYAFTAVRAPALRRPTPLWAPVRQLFNGKDLAGWHTVG